MKKALPILLLSFLVIFTGTLNAQAPTCDPSVPFHLVDLTGYPAGTWTSPVHSRDGNCCGTTNPDRCTSFEIILDTGAAMISFEIASGAVPPGSMFYQVACGPQVPVGQPICIVGAGPHYLTFCKPGNNTNTYRVTSIPKPTFPKDDTARIGCSLPINVLGLLDNSITWNSVFPGAPGDYNSYLDCTSNCDSVLYTPASNAPAFVDYVICGTPIATACGYVALCDTVRIYNFAALSGSVAPSPATFCQGGPGVLLTGTASGGQSPYSYTWYDQSLVVVGNTNTYNATAGGNFQLMVRDVLYDSLYCPALFLNAPVTATQPPVVNAGPDQTICPVNAVAILNATVQHATGGTWTGGAGTFSPASTSLFTAYTPTAAEIAAGQVTLVLTSTGAGGGCTNATDTIILFFPAPIVISVPDMDAGCNGNSATLTATVSGGTSPYAYQWSNGAVTSSITATAGIYCITVIDNLGCVASTCATITAPSALTITTGSTPCSVNGGSDGTASVSVSGGTAPYTYLWSNGGTTATITGLPYGIYTVIVTDDNGCQVGSSVVVNEPRCNSYQVTATGTDVGCFGAENGDATVSVTNGTPAYTYLWNDALAQTTVTATNLSAGVYQCLVTDANNCSAVANVTITQPAQLTNTMTHTNVTVIGGNDGTALATVNGGTPAYTYAWSNGGTTAGINTLTAGTYSVTVLDANNCTLVDSVMVSQPPCNNLTLSVVTSPASCNGGNNGSASAVILFGTAPISYLWSTGSTASSISGLVAGNYSLSITDGLNCTTFVNFAITQPSPLSAGASPTNVSCSQAVDGTIELTVNGGTYPYSYSWSNGAQVEDLIHLTNGSYSVTVTDAQGCTTTASTTITRPAPIVASSVNTDITCFGGTNGAIDASVSGGVQPYNYSWSNGATTQDISGLGAGSYILTVTDANNCVIGTPFDVSMNEPGAVHIDSMLVACPVPGSGLSQVTVYAGGGNNGSYQLSFDDGTTFLAPGISTVLLPVDSTYLVMARDTFGCLAPEADTLVIDPAVDILSVTFNPCIADGVTSIPVVVVPTGGNGGPLSVSFDNGATYLPAGTYTQQLLTGSSYTILVQDSSFCLSVPESIDIPVEISVSGTTSSFNGYGVSCFGSTDGTIDFTATGGSGTLAYAWSNGATTEDLSALPAGMYTVIVTDSIACTDTLAFTLAEPAQLTTALVATSSFNGYEISCNGANDGVADLTVSGGVTSYSYSWSNGATTQDLSGLTAGTYSVTVTDANGCTASDTIILSEPATLTSGIVAQRVFCNGASSGAADLTMNGGVTPYSFAWSNGATTEDISALPAGTYSVTVTDANGCTTNASTTVTEPAALSLSGTPTDLTCFQSGNGAIDVTAGGGILPYTFAWSNAATTEDLVNIPAGTYSLTLTDSAGCTDTISFTIAEPTLLTSNSSVTDFNGYGVSCAGSSDGIINLFVSGGTAGYTYSWSNGATTEDLNNIPAGTYSVTVTDANACTTTHTVTLTGPTPLTSGIVAQRVYCNGASSGAANLTVNGGVAPYAYAWSNGATTEDISSLPAGTYSVTVTDANGCTSTASTTITEPAAITLSGNVTDLTCFQSGNGAIDLNAGGGILPYTFVWSNSATTEDLTGISAGSYSVTLTDSAGCIATLSFTVTEPALLANSVTSTTDFNGYGISCAGNSDGAVDITVSGGTLPYTFNWSNGATTEDVSSLTAGTYNVTITDANGCTTTNTIVLTEPAPLTPGIVAQRVYCNGASSGAANLTVNGGVTPYIYVWSNGATTEDISSLPAGTYSVTVTDANGCTSTASTTITQPAAITLGGNVTDLTCFQANNGAVDLNVTGGILPYTFAWSNAATTEDLTGISAGSYSVTLTDSAGCIATLSFTVTEPALLVSNTSATNFNGYGVSCPESADGAIDLSVSGGTQAYSYSWSNGATTEDLTGLGAGTYSVTVTDANGCTSANTVTLSAPAALTANIVQQNVLCNGNTNGAIDLTVTGGVAPYSYAWSNSAVTQDLFLIPAGTYSVTITDANGCTITPGATITEPAPIVLGSTVTDLTCYQSGNGAIDLSVSGGILPYTFAWSNTAVTEDLSNIAAGNYSVVITDSAGCSATLSFTVTEPAALIVLAAITTDFNGYEVSCAGSSDGAIDLTVIGGMPGYTYSWSNGATTEDLSAIPAGSYSVVVTDANGCTSTASAALSEPPALNIAATHQDVPCNGFLTGSIDITVSGGVQPFGYAWSNGAVTEDVNAIGAGTYSVIVTDANGCTIDTTIEITESAPVIVTGVSYNPLCAGDAGGSIDISVSGGTAPYTYNWSDGQTAEDASALPSGMYSVIVTDATNCATSDTFLLVDPIVLTASLASPVNVNGYNVSSYGGTDGSINLTVAGGTLPYQYQWSNGSTTEDLTGLAAGTYSVTVTDANGCTSTATITLDQPLELAMPTGYSPNADGFNDAFVVRGIEAYPDNHIEVYNRWGNLVYSADDYANAWRGTSDAGDALPDGTYFVVLTISDGQITLKGYVDVRR